MKFELHLISVFFMSMLGVTAPHSMDEVTSIKRTHVEMTRESEMIILPCVDLPLDIWGLFFQYIDTTLEIVPRCQLELICKRMTELLKTLPYFPQWQGLKLWRVEPVKGVTWINRREGYLCYKMFEYNIKYLMTIDYDSPTYMEVASLIGNYVDKGDALFDPDCMADKAQNLLIQYECSKDYANNINLVNQIYEKFKTMGKDPTKYPKKVEFAEHPDNHYEAQQRIEETPKSTETPDYNRKFNALLGRKNGSQSNLEQAKRFLMESYGVKEAPIAEKS